MIFLSLFIPSSAAAGADLTSTDNQHVGSDRTDRSDGLVSSGTNQPLHQGRAQCLSFNLSDQMPHPSSQPRHPPLLSAVEILNGVCIFLCSRSHDTSKRRMPLNSQVASPLGWQERSWCCPGIWGALKACYCLWRVINARNSWTDRIFTRRITV